jgi:hypothetical protein
VLGLHRISHHSHEVIAKNFQGGLISKLCGEGFQRLSGVVLAAVEAPVYERLDAPPQGAEQSRDHQSLGDYGELELLLLADQIAE